MSHPQSEPFPPKNPPPLFPHPPQQQSKRIIQIQEPHPLLENVDVPHPHPVAVKSLIIITSKGLFCFMLYHMYYGLDVFLCFWKKLYKKKYATC